MKRCSTLFLIIFCVSISTLLAQETDSEQNAAVLYKESVSILTELPEDFREKSNVIINNGWKDNHQDLKKILERNRPSIEKFKEATKLEKCDFMLGKPVGKAVTAKFPVDSRLIDIVRLVLIEGRLYEKENEPELALRNYLCVLRFGNHLEQQNNFVLMSKLFAMAVEQLTFKPLKKFIARRTTNVQEYLSILRTLTILKKSKLGFEKAYEEEKENLKRIVRTLENEVKQEGDYREDFFQTFYKEYDKLVGEYFGYMITAFKNNNPEIFDNKIAQFKKELKEEVKPLNLTWEYFKKIIGKGKSMEPPSLVAKILFSISIPSFQKATTRYYVSLSELDVLLTAVAIKLYQLQNSNKTIEAIDELIPIYLSQIPQDPFNDFKPLKYKKNNKGWLVYSFGPDKIDNHGEIVYNGTNLEGKGDIVFTSF